MIEYDTNGYRLWDPFNRKLVLSRDVIFKEDEIPVIGNASERGSEVRVTSADSFVSEDRAEEIGGVAARAGGNYWKSSSSVIVRRSDLDIETPRLAVIITPNNNRDLFEK